MRSHIKEFPKQEYYWLIPGSIDLPRMLQQHPPPFKPKLDYFYHILDTICRKMDYLDPKDDRRWIRLSSERLKAFNSNYAAYLEYLQAKGIVRVSNYYKPGKECRGYRINSWFLKGEPVEIPVSPSDFILKKKVKALRQRETEKRKASAEKHHRLSKWFNEKLTIDAEGAKKEVLRIYALMEKSATSWKKKEKARRGRHKALRAIKRLERKDYFHHVDDNIGRLHSNITNSKREIRHFITYDGQTLVNLDIRNSQPLICGILLNPDFYRREATLSIFKIQSPLTIINKDKRIKKLIETFNYYIEFPVSPESKAWSEFEQFRRIIQSGKFYQEFFNLLYPGRPFTPEEKERSKKLVFTLLFSDNRKGPKQRKAEKPFADAFPTVYRIFTLLKRHNKTLLSNILQRTESLIIIRTATQRIARERPDLPIFTIHDSIATTLGNEDYVIGVIKEEFLRITGLNASIGKEVWTPATLPNHSPATREQSNRESHAISSKCSFGKAA